MDYKTIMAQFEERFNNEEDVNTVETETYDGVSAKRKQFPGVTKMRNCWRARIQHPKLKVQLHLGCYSTPEEAALVVKNKKAEFESMLKAEDSLSVRRKLPRGVRKSKSGNFRVQIWHPVLKTTACFGTYSTCEEAAAVADRKRAELWKLYGEKPRGHVDNDEILQDCKSEAPAKFECLDEQIAVQMGSDGLNNFEIGGKPNCGVVDVPDKLECEFVRGSHTSNIELGTSNSTYVSDERGIDQMSQRKTTCSFDFDEAVSAGFINEYGQLVGKYCELDEQMWLGLPDENFAASG